MAKTAFLFRFDASIPLKEIQQTVFDFLNFCAEREEKRSGDLFPLCVILSSFPESFHSNPSIFGMELKVYEFYIITTSGTDSVKLEADIDQFFINNDQRFDMLVENIEEISV